MHPSLHCAVTAWSKSFSATSKDHTPCQGGSGHLIGATKARRKKKEAIERLELNVGKFVRTDVGIQGFIKKITSEGELLLDSSSYYINPLSVIAD